MHIEELKDVLAKAGAFLDAFGEEQIDLADSAKLEEGRAALDEASKVISAHIAALTIEVKRKAAEEAFKLLRASGYSEVDIKRMKAALQAAKPEVAKTETQKKDRGPRYFSPENPSQMWNGLAREPLWIAKYRTSEEGKSPRVYAPECHIENHPDWPNIKS